MKNFIAVCVFTVAVVYASGPEAEDDKWEVCNSIVDNTLAYFSAYFGESNTYNIVVSPPCSKCKIWNLETFKRTGDVHFEKHLDGYNHKVPMGFDLLHMLCECQKTNQAGVKISGGQVDVTWTEPRFTIEAFTKTERKAPSELKNLKIVSKLKDISTEKCIGDSAWKKDCEAFKKLRKFNGIIEHVILDLFPKKPTGNVNWFSMVRIDEMISINVS
uniref:Uncharacterized protein n=1 Tax=Strigamia maritima TaxID=126957 RepID=T1IJE4_STRMM